ncbi:hypothetical protein AMATHDRAFT_62013 [Amanita thiersii Skay4041]|uniref:Uncharacterized protein n=1 Tax=Amanita thiersii Skay4041 TaxID=703135 RepID=A0A2A9NQG3_9AGAR|nr:hypothetical protein AMATHDRAFT_62013 [Amanita thiersii Skay4041]
MTTSVITLPLRGEEKSSASLLLSPPNKTRDATRTESELLRSIKLVLRGSDTDHISSIHSSSFLHFASWDQWEERELTWDAHTVVVSSGGVMRKQWSFREEGEAIQWACIGYIEQTQFTPSLRAHSTARYADLDLEMNIAAAASNGGGGTRNNGDRPTFGPFGQVRSERKTGTAPAVVVPAIYVFLRSIGRIFLDNGFEYTFSLPFIVRRAWPLAPHGVMIQRVLEPSELFEAEITGEPVLPTIFSMTSPFAEAAAVGLTSGIVGEHTSPPVLKDEEENLTKPLKTVAPTEMVVWATRKCPNSQDDLMMTMDVEQKRLSVWRYAYIKPKDAPVPLDDATMTTTTTTTTTTVANQTLHRKRHSVGGNGSGRRTSALFSDMFDRRERLHNMSPGGRRSSREQSPVPEFRDMRGIPSSLKSTATMGSLGKGNGAGSSSQSQSQWPGAGPRRNSLARNDQSVTLDRMVLGGRVEAESLTPIEHGRMKASYWVERVHSLELDERDAKAWRDISISLFDSRWDGTCNRNLMAICLPKSQELLLFILFIDKDKTLKVQQLEDRLKSVVSATHLRATRYYVWDLLIVKPDNTLMVLTHGTCQVPISLQEVRKTADSVVDHGKIVKVQNTCMSTVIVTYEDGYKSRATIDLAPRDLLTSSCLQILTMTLPSEIGFILHRNFLEQWWSHRLSSSGPTQFDCFVHALYKVLDLPAKPPPARHSPWARLSLSRCHRRFHDDPALKQLQLPPSPPVSVPHSSPPAAPHPLMSVVLYALHILAENFRLFVHTYELVVRLAPVICRIALVVRPEWADYWKRLVPDATAEWPPSSTAVLDYLDDRIPVWPPDLAAILFGRINTPDWQFPWPDANDLSARLGITPSFAFGYAGPLSAMRELIEMYKRLADGKLNTQSRCEAAVAKLVHSKFGPDMLNRVPLGLAAPIREALRTCQLAPPGNWPLEAYQAIGRNDLAASASEAPEMMYSDGFRPVKDFINPPKPRQTIGQIIAETRAAGSGEVDSVSGVELDLKDFTDIRFGQDRRLEEVARMLCSSTIPNIKSLERPELSEHDQTKEYQNQVTRFAERTLALPYGRALYTFGCVPTVTREAYSIPKLEFSVRIQPANTVMTPEAGKIALESMSWGEFHNGVAAGLRISPTATGVESSWIAFNKPSDLTPEHAGFLFGLGLTGHLREMLTWHTFSYLTPKHDLTSIGVLLGLSAANVGSGNQHITKLLAVHTPALLPTPSVDLNVSLLTQAAGLTGVGLLYMGSKNRRMAEVCLNQVCRKDLVQPDLSNEHREAYTYAAALAFGMIMLGKGSTIPADMALLSRLSVLIHGDAKTSLYGKSSSSFDLNLTSPAATIAIGLMYLRTGRKDVADMLTIPDTIVALNRVQPSFLLVRTIARTLIMWDDITPSSEWLLSQIPEPIRDAMELRNKNGPPLDDAMELAHYNICAGCCFVIGLKYAGTARQEAYMMIIKYFDAFTRLIHSNSPTFDYKIKRSAIRDGLNLISISLSMIMAGTGEITCFRRLRYAYGTYQQTLYHHSLKYGIHMSTHLSLGLLFLGGGRYTLGTSNAAIAAMVVAFFPRYPHVSFDNKCYLQALRHLWVLAVEPRCLIARDVDTTEVVYLPIKITMKEGNEVGTTQLISPTLIPDLDKLMSIRVDTPRYWPFFLDTENLPRHKEMLLRSQTLYVKRRTAFLSYVEDPKGSRSLFVRSGSSAGDAATLDFPQVTDTKTHPAGDLSEFITSFSNDVLFLAFADHLARGDGRTEEERLFEKYCHASLLDSILQDKPQTLQSHLTLFRYRRMLTTLTTVTKQKSKSGGSGATRGAHRFFHLRLQDLRFAVDFYGMVYERRFSGRAENNPRPPLMRDSTVWGALHALDMQLDEVRLDARFLDVLGRYARGEVVVMPPRRGKQVQRGGGVREDGEFEEGTEDLSWQLSWYLVRNGVPVSTILGVLRQLAQDAHVQCMGRGEPEGTRDMVTLDAGIREVLHGAGTKMSTTLASGWSVRSLDEVIEAWKVR